MININEKTIENLLLPRNKKGHKYDFGHAFLVCGQRGMMGAAVLAVQAALRSGCGLVSVHVPDSERFILQIACPSAMLSLDTSSYFSQMPDLQKYNAIGIGCGLGKDAATVAAVGELLKNFRKPMVIDADALNILSENTDFQKHIPEKSIFTPHLGELKCLVGLWENDEEKREKVQKLSKKTQAVIIVKGYHTEIYTPNEDVYINPTGNAGMAKGGSGDVLTGLLTGLLARGYEPENAAILGVYLHGLAGDRAAQKRGKENMNSSDIVDELKL
jgi:NAD(P)H-hydrate epimerase